MDVLMDKDDYLGPNQVNQGFKLRIKNAPALDTNFQNNDDKPMTFLRRLTSYFHKEFLTTNETKSVSRDEGSVSV